MWLKITVLLLGCAVSFLFYPAAAKPQGRISNSFDVAGVISGNRLAGVPLGRSLGDGELDIEGVCARSGMACQNCSLAVTCVSLPGGWLKVPQESCGEGLSCNAHLGSCSAEHVPECQAVTSQFRHTCEQVGMFPDAFDCRKFHLCSPPEDIPSGRPADHRAAFCPRHYGYNPQTAQCSIQLKNGQCNTIPVPPCTAVGQTGVLPASPNHYFVCLMKNRKLHPQVFICPHGWFFVNGFCRPEPGVTATTEVVQTTEAPTEGASFDERMSAFFSTEKPTTHKPDTFLADRFDLTQYESIDDAEQRQNEGSFESNEFW